MKNYNFNALDKYKSSKIYLLKCIYIEIGR